MNAHRLILSLGFVIVLLVLALLTLLGKSALANPGPTSTPKLFLEPYCFKDDQAIAGFGDYINSRASAGYELVAVAPSPDMLPNPAVGRLTTSTHCNFYIFKAPNTQR